MPGHAEIQLAALPVRKVINRDLDGIHGGFHVVCVWHLLLDLDEMFGEMFVNLRQISPLLN